MQAYTLNEIDLPQPSDVTIEEIEQSIRNLSRETHPFYREVNKYYETLLNYKKVEERNILKNTIEERLNTSTGYDLRLTNEEISTVLGIDVGKVKRIHDKAIRVLGNPKISRRLKEYIGIHLEQQE